MKISALSLDPESRRVSAEIRSDNGSFETQTMWFTWPANVDAPDGCRAATAFAQACLPIALFYGEAMQVEGEVDPCFAANWSRLVQAMKRLHGFRHEIELRAPHGQPLVKPDRKMATLFTGGVDSYFTVLSRIERPERVEALVYVTGFDKDRPLKGTRILKMLHCAAECTGTELLLVGSNAKTIVCQHVGWSSTAHGSLLAATACILSQAVHYMFIASTESIDALERLGSHPLLDPLYSTSAVTISNDGWEYSRNEKIKVIADHSFVLRHLRVCWQEGIEEMNCGRCEKCLRTMIALEIMGKLNESTAFPKKLSLARVILNGIPTGQFVRGIRSTYLELYEMCRGNKDLLILRVALGISLRIHPVTYALRKLRRR